MSTERSEPTSDQVRVLLDVTGLGTVSPDIDSDVIELAKAAGRARDNLVVVCKPRDAKLFKSFDLEVHRAPDRIRSERSRRWWIDWGLPRIARSVGASVIHSPHGVFPVLTSIPRVVGIRQSSGPNDRARRLARTVRTDVTVPTQSIADEFRESTNLPANRVHVAHLGVDKERTAIPSWESVESIGDIYGISEWVAVVAAPGDASATLAFRDGFRQATEFSGHTPTLIVLGLPEPIALEHFAELIDGGFDIRIVSGIDNDERSAILGGALISVILDDSHETGRALIDALACGATVLTRHIPALSEIGSDAVDYAEDSPASFEIAVTALLKDDERRRERATAAVTRSHAFSWDASLAAHRAAWTRAHARS
jgi:hypothetical protein